MKKILVLITAALLITTTGCMSITARKSMKESKNAVINGDYTAALNYADLAIKEGCKDKEFLALIDNVKKYQQAEDLISQRDVDKAEELLDDVEDIEGSGMAMALKSLKESIEDIKEEAKEFEDDIAEIEKDIQSGYYYISSDAAEELLAETLLTLKQRERIQELHDTAEAGKVKKSKSTPKPTTAPTPQSYPKGKAYDINFTEQEALNIARKAMSKPNANATVQFIDTYYLVNFTEQIDIGDEIITDECCCKVDCTTGEVYEQAG